MDWVIAIPSYKRATILKSKTLALLEDYKIPKEKITIFVANSEEEKVYRTELLDYQIIVAEKGLHNARNFISNYYPPSQKIVQLDDDIQSLIEFDSSCYRSEKKLLDFVGLIERGFKECIEKKARLWGVYPSCNGFFMKNTTSYHLTHIVGCFFGVINPGPEIKITLQSKEDYERSILFWQKDKVLVRFNFVSPKTAFYKTPGGLQLMRTKDNIEEEVKYLLDTYPEFVKRKLNRKTGFPEVRILKQKI